MANVDFKDLIICFQFLLIMLLAYDLEKRNYKEQKELWKNKKD